MEAILEPLIRSPKLKLYFDELAETLRLEEAARKRFRDDVNEDLRAEFINGEVIRQMASRDVHSSTIGNISRLAHLRATLGRLGIVRTEQALTAFTRNDYVPDICFWPFEKSKHFQENTAVYPVPDFIAEVVSTSTEHRDRGVKFEDYAAHGVLEYWIVDAKARRIEQYVLVAGSYTLVGAFSEGVIQSQAIEGFVMPVAAAFEDQANLATLWAMKPA